MKTWQNLTDLFITEQIETEMVKKYKYTVLGITYENKTIYAMFNGIKDNGLYSFTDVEGVELLLSANTECVVFIPQIKRGFYNTHKGIVYLTRNPYRQYKRGICKDSYKAVVVLQNINPNNFTEINVLDAVVFDVLKQQPDYTLEQGLALLKTYREARLTKDFMLLRNHTTSDHNAGLWFGTAFIGFVKDGHIELLNETFRQEILESKDSWCPNVDIGLMT